MRVVVIGFHQHGSVELVGLLADGDLLGLAGEPERLAQFDATGPALQAQRAPVNVELGEFPQRERVALAFFLEGRIAKPLAEGLGFRVGWLVFANATPEVLLSVVQVVDGVPGDPAGHLVVPRERRSDDADEMRVGRRLGPLRARLLEVGEQLVVAVASRATRARAQYSA